MNSVDMEAKADPSNDVLLDQAIAGDRQAFGRIVEAHQAYVYRMCLGITGDHHEAEEAVQETFLNAFRSLGQFRRESRFRTWLTRIAINEALQRLRKRKHPTASLDEGWETMEGWMPREISDWGPNPEQLLLADELRQALEDAVLFLPGDYRVVFVLRDICHHSTAEVADMLQLSVPAVKSRLLRARLAVRERLAVQFRKKRGPWQSLSLLRTTLRGLVDRFCKVMGIPRPSR